MDKTTDSPRETMERLLCQLRDEIEAAQDAHESSMEDVKSVLRQVEATYVKVFAPPPLKNYKIIVTIMVGDKTWQKVDPGVYPEAIVDRVQQLGAEVTQMIGKAVDQGVFPER